MHIFPASGLWERHEDTLDPGAWCVQPELRSTVVYQVEFNIPSKIKKNAKVKKKAVGGKAVARSVWSYIINWSGTNSNPTTESQVQSIHWNKSSIRTKKNNLENCVKDIKTLWVVSNYQPYFEKLYSKHEVRFLMQDTLLDMHYSSMTGRKGEIVSTWFDNSRFKQRR